MLIGSWGLYPWFEEDGEDLVKQSHSNDFKSLQPYGKLFQCIGEGKEYIKIQYNSKIFEVKPILFKIVLPPIFSFGEKVRVVNHPETLGVVCEIGWHHKNNKEVYYIDVNGKKKSSRYFSEDLVRRSCDK